MRKLSVIIPAYNESATIAEIIRRVQAVNVSPLEKEIIVVDNNSTDNTGDLARSLGVRVVEEKTPGKGAAVKRGFREASGDIVIVQDADLEYDPQDFPAVIAPILEGKSEAVNGVRMGRYRRGGRPLFLFLAGLIGNGLITLFTNVLFLNNSDEYEGCYKAFTKKLVDSIPVATNSFDYDNELVCKILQRGYTLIDVPTHYYPRSYAEGKKIGWKHGVEILWTIVKCRFTQ